MKGEKMSVIKDMSKKYNLHSWAAQKAFQPTVVTRAEGIYFWDEDGNKYYDMSSQMINMNLGHGNRALIDAIKDQAEKLAYISPVYAVDVRSEAAKLLVELAGPGFEGGKVFFTNAGAEANENAIKYCRAVTGKWKLLSMWVSYHGSTHGASELTGEARSWGGDPGMVGVCHFEGPFPYHEPNQVSFKNEADMTAYYLDRFEEVVKREGPHMIAGVFVESVVGSNGVLVPPKGYLKGMKEICEKYDILLVCDEVMAGFYRCGSKFAFHQFDVIPDIVTFAKGSTCGYVPLGGVIVNKRIADFFDDKKMYNGLTYSAHPIGCAACIAGINEYERLGIEKKVKKLGKLFAESLDKIAKKHKSVGEARYIGLFAQIELVKDRKTKEPFSIAEMGQVMGMLKKEGYASFNQENGVMVAPPLIITEQELLEGLEILDKVLSEVDANML